MNGCMTATLHLIRRTTATRDYADCERDDAPATLPPLQFAAGREYATCPACLEASGKRWAAHAKRIVEMSRAKAVRP